MTDARRLPLRLATVMFAPVDIAGLAVLRVAIGLVMFAATVRFWARGWIDELVVAPTYHLPYWFPGVGTLWIDPPGSVAMTAMFAAMAVCALLVAIGRCYRPAIVVLLVGFVYVELVDATNYLNHYYAITILLALMAVMPLHRALVLGRRDAQSTIPAWMPWALRGQLAVIYVFAGVAKLHADWLDGTVLHMWLRTRAGGAWLGDMLARHDVAQAMAIGGAIFDLAIVPLLLWRRTRAIAWLAVVGFHATTGLLFPIGMFPWIMIAASTVFFAPSWPRRWLGRATTRATEHRPQWWVAALLGAHFAMQLVLPLRSLAYPGDVRWHEQGNRWSWRVMLVEKTGIVELVVTEKDTGRTWRVDPAEELTPRQTKMMATQPDLILAYAHLVRDRFRADGIDVEVRAESWCALNGRPSQRFVDPTADLAAIEESLAPYTFVLPLVETSR